MERAGRAHVELLGDPWWLQCHGTFENGVVFDITQGHVYGQLSAKQTHNSYVDIVGTKGIARMTHDFKTAVVELHGVTQTHRIERPYGGKNIDVLCERFAQSIESGRRCEELPRFRDAAVASGMRGSSSMMHGRTTCRPSATCGRCSRSANGGGR